MKKIQNTKKIKSTPVAKKAVRQENVVNAWSWSIYAYWFIILFFIASTFYILGRSHEFMQSHSNVTITEESLVQPEDYVENAKSKLAIDDMEGAIAALNAAIAANASSTTYTLRGEAYMQLGEYQKALSDYEAALEIDGMNAVAFYDRALLNTRLENYEAALTDINNALAAQSMKPSDVLNLSDLYAKRGQLNLWLKNWEGAIADYKNSLARPEGIVTPNVYAERAEAYTALGQYSDAIADYTSAIRVISEQIQGATSTEQKEDLSSRAMTYFEKSAALNLNIGNTAAARSDLESASAIATSLDDTDTMERLQKLLNEIK